MGLNAKYQDKFYLPVLGQPCPNPIVVSLYGYLLLRPTKTLTDFDIDCPSRLPRTTFLVSGTLAFYSSFYTLICLLCGKTYYRYKTRSIRATTFPFGGKLLLIIVYEYIESRHSTPRASRARSGAKSLYVAIPTFLNFRFSLSFFVLRGCFGKGKKQICRGLSGLYDISIESICSKLCFHAIFRPCKSVQFFADLGKLGYANEIKVLICEGGSEDPLQPKSVRIRLLSLC